MGTIELRCPESPSTLLTKLLLAGEKPRVADDNLIELACDFCKRQMKLQTGVATRVMHRYNFVGELVETVTAPIIDPRQRR